MPTSLLTWEAIHHLAERACKHFDLRWPVTFVPLTRRSRDRTYGECEYDHCPTCRCPPTIRLALKGTSGRPLSRRAIMSILAHELAHLKSIRHGRVHTALTREIAAWLSEQCEPTTPHMLVIPPRR